MGCIVLLSGQFRLETAPAPARSRPQCHRRPRQLRVSERRVRENISCPSTSLVGRGSGRILHRVTRTTNFLFLTDSALTMYATNAFAITSGADAKL